MRSRALPAQKQKEKEKTRTRWTGPRRRAEWCHVIQLCGHRPLKSRIICERFVAISHRNGSCMWIGSRASPKGVDTFENHTSTQAVRQVLRHRLWGWAVSQSWSRRRELSKISRSGNQNPSVKILLTTSDRASLRLQFPSSVIERHGVPLWRSEFPHAGLCCCIVCVFMKLSRLPRKWGLFFQDMG